VVDLSWLAIGAIGTLAMSIWAYVRGFWGYIASFVVVRTQLTHVLSLDLNGYCARHFKLNRYGKKYYGIGRYALKADGKTPDIVYEDTEFGAFYWAGWAPIWLTIVNQSGGGGSQITVVTLRWLTDIEKLLQAVGEEETHRRETGQYGMARFKLIEVFGTARYMPGGNMQLSANGSSPFDNSNSGSSPTVVATNYSWVVGQCQRLLGYDRDMIGPVDNIKPLAAVALGDDAKAFVERANRWYASRDWCVSRGLPWKLGAVLQGQPGTGKTTFVKALAASLDLPIVMFNLSSITTTEFHDLWLTNMSQYAPCVALFEDIHTVFNKEQEANDWHKLGLEVVLQSLSGVQDMPGVLAIATTNDISKMPDALLRPGRLECQIKMDALDAEHSRVIVERILKDWPELQEIVMEASDGRTGATIQQICIDIALRLIEPGADPTETAEDVLATYNGAQAPEGALCS
jgi:ATPase family associated with various cellular activities (AAA)